MGHTNPEQDAALDLIGQTRLWLGLAAEIDGKGGRADTLAYLRDAGQFRNVLLVERPNGGFCATLMRQFLFDARHHAMPTALSGSAHTGIAGIAAKAVKEVSYHLERSADLVVRLGDGTAESHARMQAALDLLRPYTGELFATDAVDEALAARQIAPRPDSLRPGWQDAVAQVLGAATLTIPAGTYFHKSGKRGVHTEHLGYILAEMQFLQRAYPGAVW